MGETMGGNDQARRNPLGWWILFALIVLGVIVVVLVQRDQAREERDRYEDEQVRKRLHERTLDDLRSR
jgi:cytochrome c-type biogenesis protein CcmH/NrfF